MSLDKWHDSIDKKVVTAFTEDIACFTHVQGTEGRQLYSRKKNDLRGVNFVTKPVRAGRCTWGTNKCAGGRIVKPNGDVVLCGCNGSPIIGSIYDDKIEAPCDDDGREITCVKELVEFCDIGK